MPARRQPLALAGALGHATADKRVEILRRVGEAGSISQAARDAGVSYKAAWQALDTLSNLAGAALVQRAVGGAGGGGAQLTPAGRQLLASADAVARAREATLAHGAAGLGLRTSMRNQVPCAVAALHREAGAVRVILAPAPGVQIAARITNESAQLLGLRVGIRVLALWKATAVAVRTQARPTAGRNRLAGSVSRGTGTRGGEVALALPGGLAVVGFAPAGAALRKGAPAVAVFDESAVVVGLAD